MVKELTNLTDIQLRLMAIAYFYGDFSIVYHFVHRASSIYNAVSSNDANALKNYMTQIEDEMDELTSEQVEQLNAFENEIRNKYEATLRKNALPVPESYFEELAERATTLKNYTTAHSAMDAVKKLDKLVNQYIVHGVELLDSKEVRGSGEHDEEHIVRKKMQQAAEAFYNAIRIKDPLGNLFQNISEDLIFKDHDSLRKYNKYVELNLLKEIIEFIIQYLTDDKAISSRIIDHLNTGKNRKLFLKYFAQQFSNGEAEFNKFIERYKQAVDVLKNSKTDDNLFTMQRLMLGRGTGENEFYQYLRELAVEHPISTLLITIAQDSGNSTFLAPIVLKSGVSILEFLELD